MIKIAVAPAIIKSLPNNTKSCLPAVVHESKIHKDIKQTNLLPTKTTKFS